MKGTHENFPSQFAVRSILLTVALIVALAVLVENVTTVQRWRTYASITLLTTVYYGLLLFLVHSARDPYRPHNDTETEQSDASRTVTLSSSAEPNSRNFRISELYVSPRWKTTLGYKPDELSNTPEAWFGCVHTDDVDRLKSAIAAHIEGEASHFTSEHRMLHKDGTHRWMLTRGLAVRDSDGSSYRLVGSQTDITEQKQAEEKQRYDAFHDTLTDLANVTLLIDGLERALDRTRQSADDRFALLLLDLDEFAAVNERFGYSVGDRLLVAVGRRLAACLRPTDMLARLQGDTFAILLEDVSGPSDVYHVADRIRARFNSPFAIDGHEVNVAVSGGSVTSEKRHTYPADVLLDAEIALHTAKKMGTGQHKHFDATMRPSSSMRRQWRRELRRMRKRQQLETELRRALERQEFRLRYQPIVSLETGRITGLEALLRWQHQEHGLMAPADFADLAEETGLIVPIGLWVLHTACEQMCIWHERFPADPPLVISVNLSRKQLTQPDFVDQVDRVLAETGLEPRALSLDITESGVTETPEVVAPILSALRERGVHMHVDDFSTDRPTLSHVQELPVDTIKIDRSFIETVARNGSSAEAIRAIVARAHALGLTVAAEGLETHEQLAHLQKLGFEDAQGFLLCDPLEGETVAPLLSIFS